MITDADKARQTDTQMRGEFQCPLASFSVLHRYATISGTGGGKMDRTGDTIRDARVKVSDM